MTLGQLLDDPDAYDWRATIFAPSLPVAQLSWETEVLVIPFEELPPDDPPEAVERGVTEFATMHQLQEIISALKLHGVPAATTDQRLAALRYYREHDAFISREQLG